MSSNEKKGAKTLEVSQKWGDRPSHCSEELTFGAILLPTLGEIQFFRCNLGEQAKIRNTSLLNREDPAKQALFGIKLTKI